MADEDVDPLLDEFDALEREVFVREMRVSVEPVEVAALRRQLRNAGELCSALATALLRSNPKAAHEIFKMYEITVHGACWFKRDGGIEPDQTFTMSFGPPDMRAL